jgi:hypothetical protein
VSRPISNIAVSKAAKDMLAKSGDKALSNFKIGEAPTGAGAIDRAYR